MVGVKSLGGVIVKLLVRVLPFTKATVFDKSHFLTPIKRKFFKTTSLIPFFKLGSGCELAKQTYVQASTQV